MKLREARDPYRGIRICVVGFVEIVIERSWVEGWYVHRNRVETVIVFLGFGMLGHEIPGHYASVHVHVFFQELGQDFSLLSFVLASPDTLRATTDPNIPRQQVMLSYLDCDSPVRYSIGESVERPSSSSICCISQSDRFED